ncbi:hypothetical protein [Hydrogenophaga sp.]|uniref:hypothetical protein n=1 Tax=Hydrogenophaga sp. TaxID=1904254 RepID=UPI00271A1E91|nr:hypothetical protein [Hydrogenophaga sp.]MDO9438818.1 hypothetical protein [Hydrogenophaga sp.]
MKVFQDGLAQLIKLVTPEPKPTQGQGLDIRDPKQLSQCLTNGFLDMDPRFSIAEENSHGKLSSGGVEKILVLPSISLQVGIAFHSVVTNTWYAINCTMNQFDEAIAHFKSTESEARGFACDSLVLMNAPDVADSIPLSKTDVEPIARELLSMVGGRFTGNVAHLDCDFKRSYEARKSHTSHLEQRNIMLAPEAHAIYVFDESGRHLFTQPL